jgi:hypothetical protein
MNSPGRSDALLPPLRQVAWMLGSLTLLGLSLYFSLG